MGKEAENMDKRLEMDSLELENRILSRGSRERRLGRVTSRLGRVVDLDLEFQRRRLRSHLLLPLLHHLIPLLL